MVVFDDRELVDREPVVRLEILEIDDPRLSAADISCGSSIFDRHTVNQEAMERAVSSDEVGALGPGQLAKGIRQRLGRKIRVEPGERVAQPPFENDLPPVGPLRRRCAGCQLGAMADRPPRAFEPGECCFFNHRFAK